MDLFGSDGAHLPTHRAEVHGAERFIHAVRLLPAVVPALAAVACERMTEDWVGLIRTDAVGPCSACTANPGPASSRETRGLAAAALMKTCRWIELAQGNNVGSICMFLCISSVPVRVPYR